MSLYEAIATARSNKNIDEYMNLFHDDFRFVSHQDGTSMDKQAFAEKTGKLMSSGSLQIQSQRCIYENDEILVSHTILDFPDGTTEAVMTVHKLKDGKIIEIETGATLVSS